MEEAFDVMSVILLIPGNVNTASFANCIMAATEIFRTNVNDFSAKFNKVHVLHTRESLATFVAWPDSDKWLEPAGLHQSDLVHHVIEMSDDSNQRLDELIVSVASATNSRSASECYFDLTGGITQIKVALAILAFLLGATNVYTLEIKFAEKEKEQRKWMLSDLRSADALVAYKQISGLERFDIFGLSNFTSVDRIGSGLVDLRKVLEQSLPPDRAVEVEHLISLLGLAEKLRLEQVERSRVNASTGHDERAATRSLLFHSMAAAEALVDLVIDNTTGLTLGRKLSRLRDLADARSPHPIDSLTLKHLSDLLLRLRNRAAHWSNPTPDPQSLVLQGDLGLHLSKSFIWLVTMSLESFLGETEEIAKIQSHDESVMNDGEWFVGIDGDGTGGYIVSTMRNTRDCEPEIRLHSFKISEAIKKLKETIARNYGNRSIIFATGDNILFFGKTSPAFVHNLINIYRQETELTASAGVGRTPQQASIALSLAKAEGGGAMKVVTLADD